MEWARREHGIHWAGMHVIQYPLYIPYNHTVTQPTVPALLFPESIPFILIVIVIIIVNTLIPNSNTVQYKYIYILVLL